MTHLLYKRLVHAFCLIRSFAENRYTLFGIIR